MATIEKKTSRVECVRFKLGKYVVERRVAAHFDGKEHLTFELFEVPASRVTSLSPCALEELIRLLHNAQRQGSELYTYSEQHGVQSRADELNAQGR